MPIWVFFSYTNLQLVVLVAMFVVGSDTAFSTVLFGVGSEGKSRNSKEKYLTIVL
jgi:hypothetical protein